MRTYDGCYSNKRIELSIYREVSIELARSKYVLFVSSYHVEVSTRRDSIEISYRYGK